jgi:hypothetical protein
MRRVGAAWAFLLALGVLSIAWAPVPAFAAGRQFEGVVSGLESRFGLRATHIPMMGFASFCANIFTAGGVGNMRIAQFDHVGPAVTPEALTATLRGRLNSSWHLFVTDHQRDTGEYTIVYQRVAHRVLFLMIADLENGELSLVQLRLNEKRMVAWVENPQGSLKNRPGSK